MSVSGELARARTHLTVRGRPRRDGLRHGRTLKRSTEQTSRKKIVTRATSRSTLTANNHQASPFNTKPAARSPSQRTAQIVCTHYRHTSPSKRNNPQRPPLTTQALSGRGHSTFLRSFGGRPRGRRLASNPQRRAVSCCQGSLPEGAPRSMRFRNAANSASLREPLRPLRRSDDYKSADAVHHALQEARRGSNTIATRLCA